MFVAETTLHYRCAFDLHARSTQDPFRSAVFALQRWLKRKERDWDQATSKREWFFRGGQWKRSGGSASVETVCEASGEKGINSWAFRYEHLDQTHPMRFWRTEVGLEHLDDRSLRVAVRLGYGVRSGYVGDEPDEPTPSCPNVVKELIRLNGFEAYIGPTRLTDGGQGLVSGRGNLFVSLLTNKNRVVPIALVGLNDEGVPAIDVRKLAGVTAGALDTWVAGSVDVHEELSHLLPRPFGLGRGMVRLYQSKPDLDHAERDSRRHRFFTAAQVEEQGADAVIEQIAEAVTRRFPLSITVQVLRPEHVQGRNRTLELRQRLSRQARSDGEWQELLETELARLQPFEARVTDLERDLQETQDQVDSLEHAVKSLESRAFDAEQQSRELKQAKKSVESLNLPESLEEVIDWVQAIFPGRLVFTPEARQSAGESAISRKLKELPGIFELLKSMATDLHEIFFDISPRDPATHYKNETGFELAMTEGSTTKKNPELMRLRRLTFEGRDLDMTPHVKYGNDKNEALRVHFFVDRETRRLIIGHCGNHLDTAGTRRM